MCRKAAWLIAAGLLVVGCGPAEQGAGPLGRGVVAPAIEAEGWLGAAPNASAWTGRVVVLEVWAYW